MKEDLIERYGFGVMADRDEVPNIFSHSDRFLIMDLKNRKKVIFEEYRENPHAKTCKKKYVKPHYFGDKVPKEAMKIYKDIAEILKDCSCVVGKNMGYAPKVAMEKLDIFCLMQSVDELPRDYIKRLIEIRAWAGFRD